MTQKQRAPKKKASVTARQKTKHTKTGTTRKIPTVKKKTTGRSKKAARSIRRKKKLVQASSEKCFWVYNGPILNNLQELEDALHNEISDEQFSYHNNRGNDFAKWVDEVLGDGICAKALVRAKTRKGAVTVVARYLKEYK